MTNLNKPVFSLLLVCLFFTACNAQTSNKPTNKPTNEPIVAQPSFTNKNAKLIKTQGSDAYQQVVCSLQDKKGNIWFGTSKEGIYKYDGKEFTQFTVKDGLSNNQIVCMFEDKNGDIWFGSKATISRYNGNKFTTITLPSSLGGNFLSNTGISNTPYEKNELWSMMQDRSGIIWLGMTDGVYNYDGKKFTRFLDNKNIINTSKVNLKGIQCIYEDIAGNIWFAAWVLTNEGVCRYDGKSITQFKPYGEGWVRSILEDKDGKLLIVTRHSGVCRFDGEHFTNFTQTGGIDNTSITMALKDRAGNIWFGTELGSGGINEDGGLWRYDGKTFTRFTRADGLCHNGVYSILEDNKGNIWVGARNTDLCMYNGKTFTKFSE